MPGLSFSDAGQVEHRPRPEAPKDKDNVLHVVGQGHASVVPFCCMISQQVA